MSENNVATEIAPARPNNALLEASTVFLFEKTLSIEQVKQIQTDFVPALKHLGFTELVELNVNEISIGFDGTGEGTGKSQDPQYAGFQVVRKEKEHPAWQIAFNRKMEPNEGSFLVITCFLYESWVLYKKELDELLHTFPESLDRNLINRVGTVYTDGFSIRTTKNPFEVLNRDVVNKYSKFLPLSIHKSDAEWSMNVSSVQTKPILGVEHVQVNIQAIVLSKQEGALIVKLAHVQEFKVDVARLLTGNIDEWFFILDFAHGENRILIKDVLQPTALNLIGLTK